MAIVRHEQPQMWKVAWLAQIAAWMPYMCCRPSPYAAAVPCGAPAQLPWLMLANSNLWQPRCHQLNQKADAQHHGCMYSCASILARMHVVTSSAICSEEQLQCAARSKQCTLKCETIKPETKHSDCRGAAGTRPAALVQAATPAANPAAAAQRRCPGGPQAQLPVPPPLQQQARQLG